MALRSVLALAILCSSFVDAAPTIAFPLNSQVPPVARIGEPYSYTFSSSTFNSPLPLSYTLSYGPGWLSLDSNTQTLTGTPSARDAGSDLVTGVTIGLTASDSTGSTTLHATLVISRNSGPSINIPVSAQLQHFGVYSAPSTLLYHPSTPFRFVFDPNTFSADGGNPTMSYYAVSSNNSPLPAWISFDSNSLAFSGQTPDIQSLIQPPQTFGVRLIASDVQGFSATSISFFIEVGVHLLAFDAPNLVINASAGTLVNFNGLSGTLRLDGQVPKTSDLASVVAQTPSWMSFDSTSLILSGLVPKDAFSYNITVEAKDIYGDVAAALVYLDFPLPDKLFQGRVPPLNATIGSMVSFDLGSYLQNKEDVDMTIQFSPSENWLNFDPHSFNMTGKVPSTTKPTDIQVKLVATSKSRGTSETQTFRLSLNSGPTSIIAGLPTHTSESPTPSRTIATVAKVPPPSHPSKVSTGVWLAIFLPVTFALLLLLIALIYFCHRRRAAKKRPGAPEKSQISAPLPENTSSIEIVVTPPRISPPQPLELNMSGFTHHRYSAVHGTSRQQQNHDITINRAHNVHRQTLTRSKTVNDCSEGAILARLRESGTSRNIRPTRSVSDNALSKIGSSWRSTQESAYTMRDSFRNRSQRSLGRNQSHRSQQLARQYSNYSRKGHRRSSARIVSVRYVDGPGPAIQREMAAPGTDTSLLRLKSNSFSAKPIDNFSLLHSASSNKPPSESIYSGDLGRAPSTRRQSRFTPTLDATPIMAVGHGGRRQSISAVSTVPDKRRSIGHGREWETPRELKRESRTWLTVTTNGPYEQGRGSIISASSEYEEMRPKHTPFHKGTIRQVTKSPSIQASYLSEGSGNSRLSRPISRRIGSSPFFAGSSSRRDSKKSLKSPKKIRTSYADSPTVPEEGPMAPGISSFEETIIQGMREAHDPNARDSFGISYGLAREGTRQLRSYIQSQFSRPRTGRSSISSISKDSRFESPETSAVSLQQVNVNQSPQRENDGFEEYMQENYSEGSWETAPRTIGGMEREETPQEVMEAVRLAVGREGGATGSKEEVGIGPNAKIVRGAGRRPISVDLQGQAEKGASRAFVEGSGSGKRDYTAYI